MAKRAHDSIAFSSHAAASAANDSIEDASQETSVVDGWRREALERLLGDTATRTRTTADFANGELSNALESLSKIYRHARGHATELAELEAQFSLKHDSQGPIIDDSATVSMIMAEQFRNAARFMAEFEAKARQQTEISQSAAEAAGQISERAEQLTQLASSAHLLSLNLRIEAHRLGDAGAAVAVIAEEFGAFATEVRQTSDSVDKVAGNIVTSLPQIARGAAELLRGCEEEDGKRREAQERFEVSRNFILDAIERSHEGADLLQTSASNLLTSLQFQERMDAMLRCVANSIEAGCEMATDSSLESDEAEEQIEQLELNFTRFDPDAAPSNVLAPEEEGEPQSGVIAFF